MNRNQLEEGHLCDTNLVENSCHRVLMHSLQRGSWPLKEPTRKHVTIHSFNKLPHDVG